MPGSYNAGLPIGPASVVTVHSGGANRAGQAGPQCMITASRADHRTHFAWRAVMSADWAMNR